MADVEVSAPVVDVLNGDEHEPVANGESYEEEATTNGHGDLVEEPDTVDDDAGPVDAVAFPADDEATKADDEPAPEAAAAEEDKPSPRPKATVSTDARTRKTSTATPTLKTGVSAKGPTTPIVRKARN